MFEKLRRFIQREVIDDCPPTLDLCLDCGELECSRGRFDDCVRRKTRAAQIVNAMAENRTIKRA